MDIGLGIALTILVSIVAILQGFSMRKKNGSSMAPVFYKPDGILAKLDEIKKGIDDMGKGITGNHELLGQINVRINDCWNELNKNKHE